MISNALGEFQQEAGLTDEGLRVLLSDRSGRELTPLQVRRLKGRKAAAGWVREALDLPPEEEVESEEDRRQPAAARLEDQAPYEPRERAREQSPPGTMLEPVVPDWDVKTVREVLTTAYCMVGKGAAYAGREPRYEDVFRAHAERCAEAWIELAKRDAKVARVLVSLTAGGAWGQVILIHASLLASILVVSGKIKLPDEPLPAAPGLTDDVVEGASDGRVDAKRAKQAAASA